MKTSSDEQSTEFLVHASLLYKDRCPELARFLMQQPMKVKDPPKQKFSSLCQDTLVCPHCFQWLLPDNHRVRLRPKQRPSAAVQSVLRKKARGKWLSPVQKSLLQRFYKSSSVLMATCHTCTKTSRHKGMNREFVGTLAKTHSTPGSAGKHKMPQSTNRSNTTTPKTPGKDKTPLHTPRSSTSSASSNTPGSESSSSSSKPPKAKNWVVQRLSKILMREDNQGKKKGGLKDFLSSL